MSARTRTARAPGRDLPAWATHFGADPDCGAVVAIDGSQTPPKAHATHTRSKRCTDARAKKIAEGGAT